MTFIPSAFHRKRRRKVVEHGVSYTVVDIANKVLYTAISKIDAIEWILHARVGEPYLMYYRIATRKDNDAQQDDINRLLGGGR